MENNIRYRALESLSKKAAYLNLPIRKNPSEKKYDNEYLYSDPLPDEKEMVSERSFQHALGRHPDNQTQQARNSAGKYIRLNAGNLKDIGIGGAAAFGEGLLRSPISIPNFAIDIANLPIKAVNGIANGYIDSIARSPENVIFPQSQRQYPISNNNNRQMADGSGGENQNFQIPLIPNIPETAHKYLGTTTKIDSLEKIKNKAALNYINRSGLDLSGNNMLDNSALYTLALKDNTLNELGNFKGFDGVLRLPTLLKRTPVKSISKTIPKPKPGQPVRNSFGHNVFNYGAGVVYPMRATQIEADDYRMNKALELDVEKLLTDPEFVNNQISTLKKDIDKEYRSLVEMADTVNKSYSGSSTYSDDDKMMLQEYAKDYKERLEQLNQLIEQLNYLKEIQMNTAK